MLEMVRLTSVQPYLFLSCIWDCFKEKIQQIDTTRVLVVSPSFISFHLRVWILPNSSLCAVCCAQLLSHVQLFVTPWTVAARLLCPWGFFKQERILEWVAMSSSRGSSHPRDRTQVSWIEGGFLTIWATREAQEYWSG